MAKPQKAKTNDNKPEKSKKVVDISTLTPKKALELDHLAGKHKENDFPDCGYCNRRTIRGFKKAEATKRHFASQKS